MATREKRVCKYCGLKALPSMLPGICRYHWAGHLSHIPGKVPEDLKDEYQKEIEKNLHKV
jgi:hypothetical protein